MIERMESGRNRETTEDMPLVSLIVPVFNVENYLHKCVESLRKQTFSRIEIILVDDGSTDQSGELCDRYSMHDTRIRVVHKMNEGLGYARNTGIALARGKYVWFVDSDDYLASNAIEILWKTAIETDAEICLGGVYIVTEGEVVSEHKPKYGDRCFEGDEITETVLKDMLGTEPRCETDYLVRMSAWQGLYKLEWINKYRIAFPSEREYISEDIIFHIHALPLCNKLVYVNKPLYYHRSDNVSSLTHTYSSSRFEKYKQLYLEEVRIIQANQFDPECVIRAQRTFLGNVRVCMKQAAFCSSDPISEISEMVNDNIVQRILDTYPIDLNPKPQRALSQLMKLKLCRLIYILIKLYNMK